MQEYILTNNDVGSLAGKGDMLKYTHLVSANNNSYHLPRAFSGFYAFCVSFHFIPPTLLKE